MVLFGKNPPVLAQFSLGYFHGDCLILWRDVTFFVSHWECWCELLWCQSAGFGVRAVGRTVPRASCCFCVQWERRFCKTEGAVSAPAQAVGVYVRGQMFDLLYLRTGVFGMVSWFLTADTHHTVWWCVSWARLRSWKELVFSKCKKLLIIWLCWLVDHFFFSEHRNGAFLYGKWQCLCMCQSSIKGFYKHWCAMSIVSGITTSV